MGLRYDKTTAQAIARAVKICIVVNKEKSTKTPRLIDAILMMYQTESLQMVATGYEN